MAWLTHLDSAELRLMSATPDLATLNYWVARFEPVLGVNGADEEVVIVCANRTGEEGITPRVGEVRYAGSSCVMGLKRGSGEESGQVRLWDILGRAEEGILVVDTDEEPKFSLERRKASIGESSDEQDSKKSVS